MHPLDIVFWACLMLGGAYTLITLLMGGLSHVGGHVHVGDLANAAQHLPGHLHVGHLDGGHVGDSAVGHADAGHAAHGHAEAHHGHDANAEDGGARFNLLAYLNPMAVSGFMLGFGGAGVMSRILGAHPLASTLYGLAGGIGLWSVAYLVAVRVFAASEGTSHNRQESLIGMRAHVTAPIAGAKAGMVSYIVLGSRQSMRAICDDEDSIPVGAAVRIRRIEAGTAHVIPVEKIGSF